MVRFKSGFRTSVALPIILLPKLEHFVKVSMGFNVAPPPPLQIYTAGRPLASASQRVETAVARARERL